MTLDKDDKKWIVGAIKIGVSEGVREALDEVVMPGFAMIDRDVREVKEKVQSLESGMNERFDGLDRKLMAITDHHGERLDNHEKRLSKVELAVG